MFWSLGSFGDLPKEADEAWQVVEQAQAMMVCELRSRENREFERKSLQSEEEFFF